MIRLKYVEVHEGVPVAEKHGAVTKSFRSQDTAPAGADWFDLRLCDNGWIVARFKGEGVPHLISPSTAKLAHAATDVVPDAKPAKSPR